MFMWAAFAVYGRFMKKLDWKPFAIIFSVALAMTIVLGSHLSLLGYFIAAGFDGLIDLIFFFGGFAFGRWRDNRKIPGRYYEDQ